MRTIRAVALFFVFFTLSSVSPNPTAVAREVHPARELTPDYAALFPRVFTRQGPPVRKVALTFDDGPDGLYTPQILDILKREHVRATFFVLGVQVRNHPAVLMRILREGHAIGNHSYDHSNLAHATAREAEREVRLTDELIYRYTGLHPRFFRAPYGNVNSRILDRLDRLGYRAVNWSVDSRDWRSLRALQVERNVLSGVFPGAIVLQHCAGNEREILTGTVQALPRIIHALRARGYAFTTVPGLLSPETRPAHADSGQADGLSTARPAPQKPSAQTRSSHSAPPARPRMSRRFPRPAFHQPAPPKPIPE